MFIKLLASAAKQKFIYELERNIPETGNFEAVKCSLNFPVGYKVCFELSPAFSGEKRAITVTAEKNGCKHMKNLMTGTNSEVLEWLCKADINELAVKANEAVYGCSHIYYP